MVKGTGQEGSVAIGPFMEHPLIDFASVAKSLSSSAGVDSVDSPLKPGRVQSPLVFCHSIHLEKNKRELHIVANVCDEIDLSALDR